MLRHNGCLLGKLSALLTSQTAAPAVSASSTRLSNPPGRRPAYSARIRGCSAATSLSAMAASARGRQRDILRELVLLQRRVVAHVDRALRLGGHHRIGAREGFRHAFDRARLVVPLAVVADGVALDQRGVGPIDMRAPAALVHGA